MNRLVLLQVIVGSRGFRFSGKCDSQTQTDCPSLSRVALYVWWAFDLPDVAVFKWERIPRDPDGRVANAFQLAPDWTVEILSPDQSQTKVIRNILHCLENGAEMGWLIDPEERSVFVYFADRPVAICEHPSAQIPVPESAEGFELTVGELFGWLAGC